MLYVLYTYYNRVNDLVIEVRQSVGIPNSQFSTLSTVFCLLAECPCLAGRLQCAVVWGRNAFSQNSSDLSDADANAFGGKSVPQRRVTRGSEWLPFSCGMHFIWQILILPLCMRSISSLVSVCFAPLADKSRQRLPHDFGHVSESVECILFVLYHVAWRDQQMSWKPKLFGHATCPKTVQERQ